MFLGFELRHINSKHDDPIIDKDEKFLAIYKMCEPFTMTSKVNCYALYKAIEYIVRANISGSIVECGVWKGGNGMLIALTLKSLSSENRDIYLYDTYAGMTEPTKYDVSNRTGESAHSTWKISNRESVNEWGYASIDEVKKNLYSTCYPNEKIKFIKGSVEDTIPKISPSEISLLRLDTDWYESTKHELEHLYPTLNNGGVLIIDDYGSWAGAKKATDEYLEDYPILLNRIDSTARCAIKVN